MENECKKYLGTGLLNFIIAVWSDREGRAPLLSSESAPAPGLTTQMPVGQMPEGSNRLWTRTLDRYTRTVLSESGPQAEATQDRTQAKHTHPEITIFYLAGNRTRTAGLEGREYTDHATATDCN